MNPPICCLVALICSISVVSFAISPVLGISSVNIFPPGSKPFGLTYVEHAENFWNWTYGIPAAENPINDPTGEKCGNGQLNTNSSVFYLAFNNGGRSERTCEVPAGKGLLIPVMQVAVSKAEEQGSTIEDLHKAAKKDQDSVNSLYLKIDDKEYSYEDLLKYRIHTGVFAVIFPDKPVFGVVKSGPSEAVADGFYILTEPLQAGNHTVHFRSSLICSDLGCAEPNFAQDIKYTILAK